MDRQNILRPEFNLFNRPLGYLNLKDWKCYFFRRRWLLKNGYPYIATQEFYETFRILMRDALIEFNKGKVGNPTYFTFDEWTDKITEIIDQLNDSDENNLKYNFMDYGEKAELVNTAKNKALNMLKEYWWHLWD